MLIYVLVSILLLIFVYGVYWECSRRRMKQKRFASRKQLTIDQIYSDYFSGKSIDIEKFRTYWIEIGNILRIDIGLLRPEDRFSDELKPVEGKEISDELEELFEYFSSISEDEGIQFDPREISCLGDLMLVFASSSPK